MMAFKTEDNHMLLSEIRLTKAFIFMAVLYARWGHTGTRGV